MQKDSSNNTSLVSSRQVPEDLEQEVQDDEDPNTEDENSNDEAKRTEKNYFHHEPIYCRSTKLLWYIKNEQKV